jgi:hypothetical protein
VTENKSAQEKRRCDTEEEEQEGVVLGNKKVCQPVVSLSYLELAEDGRSACAGEEGLSQLPLKQCAAGADTSSAGSNDLRCMQELVEGPHFDSILAKTLLAARQAADTRRLDSAVAVERSSKEIKNNNKSVTSSGAGGPRVVVEQQPVLPAIFELGQILSMRGQFDSAEEEEEEEEEDVMDSESEDEEEEEESSMFDTPPKHSFDRFWPTVTSHHPSEPAAVVVVSTSGGLLTPPSSPQALTTAAATSTTTTTTMTYQFLDQTSQRIECDENGKSYLQLGTVSHHHHHHLPVTPVIQPKPLLNLAHNQQRRGLPSCRPLLSRPANPTPPPCEQHHHIGHHSAGGLFSSSFPRRPHQSPRRCSPCYRQQRSDMLSLSLHKLHSARQRSDSSLRRSVLICNMLRYIEDESTTEQREEQEAQHHLAFHHQQDQHQSYWANQMAGFVSAPPTPNPYRDSSGGGGDVAGCGGGGGSFASVTENSVGSFDAPLKDFNSAFRQAALSQPAVVNGGSHQHHQDVVVNSSEEEERAINWSSVLSLSSQAELDPLNNNTYTDTSHHSLWTTAVGGPDSADVDLSQHSFDDISWKLSPISADEVLKAFPDENLFQCAA